MNFRQRHNLEHAGFQLAPMIDVVFLLLCFFIASQVFSQWEQVVDIKLPTASTGKAPQRLPGEVIINILDGGLVVVNRQNLSDERLGGLLSSIVEQWGAGQPLLIRADKRTDYEHIMKVLDMCRRVDMWNISFATTASEES